MPMIPSDFEASSSHFKWDKTKLTPLKTWSTQKWSSKLNKIIEIEGTLNDKGDRVTTTAEVTDATAKTAHTYRLEEGCSESSGV